jgi:putative N6-adenine-specific DNA methylase
MEELKLRRSGVQVNGTLTEAYRINLGSRIASRVLMPLRRFRCPDAKALYQEVSSIDWRPYFKRGQTFAIDHHVHQNADLRNSMYAAQIVKDALCDQLRKKTGKRPSVNTEAPDVRLDIHVFKDRATLSFDTSGAPLNQRGYRKGKGGAAPLRENLAAALLRLAGYTGETGVTDPCCGAGTLLIEAAWIATRTPPGCLRRRWGFQGHPDYDAKAWEEERARQDAQRRTVSQPFVGIELKGPGDAERCAKQAGVNDLCKWYRGDFREVYPEELTHFMITNPPYGRRIGESERLVELYRALGDFMKQRVLTPGKGLVFTGNLTLAKQVGLRSNKRHIVNNGGVESRLLEFDLY